MDEDANGSSISKMGTEGRDWSKDQLQKSLSSPVSNQGWEMAVNKELELNLRAHG